MGVCASNNQLRTGAAYGRLKVIVDEASKGSDKFNDEVKAARQILEGQETKPKQAEACNQLAVAILDKIQDTNSEAQHKFYALLFLKHMLDQPIPGFATSAIKVLGNILRSYARHRSGDRSMSRGKDVFAKINPNADPEWSERFFYLLLECIQYWGNKARNPGSNLPTDFFDMYNDLRGTSRVTFPTENKYLDWPLKNDPLKVNQNPQKIVNADPVAASPKPDASPARQSGPASPQQPPERLQQNSTKPKPEVPKLDTEPFLQNLDMIGQFRQAVVEGMLNAPQENEVYENVKTYAENAQQIKEDAQKLKGHPEHKELMDALLREVQGQEQLLEAYNNFVEVGEERQLKKNIVNTYRDVFEEDINAQVNISDSFDPPKAHPSPVKHHPGLDREKSFEMNLSQEQRDLMGPPTRKDIDYDLSREDSVGELMTHAGITKGGRSPAIVAQPPKLALSRPGDNTSLRSNSLGKSNLSPVGGPRKIELRNPEHDTYDLNHARYKEDKDTKKLHELEDELERHEEKKRHLVEVHEREMEARAEHLRKERIKRQAEEEKLMQQRANHIADLVNGATSKSKLLPSSTQTKNLIAYNQLHGLNFDLNSASSKAKNLSENLQTLQKETTDAEMDIEYLYQQKSDQLQRLADLEETRHELEESKEILKRRLTSLRAELNNTRLEAGGGGKNAKDEEVENDIQNVDKLLVFKLAEVAREKARFDYAKKAYEDHLLENERKRAQDRKNHNDNTNKEYSRMLDRSLPLEYSALRQSSAKPYQTRAHIIPNVASEVVRTPGSQFLDEFNKDIMRLLYKD